MKPNKKILKNRLTDWSTYQQSTDYSIYCIKMQLKTKKRSATGLHNNALKNEKDIDMICWFGPKWDIISYLISPEFWGYYIISYIPLRDIISDIDMQRHISFLPLRKTSILCCVRMHWHAICFVTIAACVPQTLMPKLAEIVSCPGNSWWQDF